MAGNWRLASRRNALRQRAAIVQGIRRFFVRRGYLEVETPQRIPAPAPESQIDAIPADGWFLHTSPELCMKRLLAAGYPRIFQISHCWRRGERGNRHCPEFTLLEWYRASADYRDLMDDCERLIPSVARVAGVPEPMTYAGHKIELTPPWERVSVREAFVRYGALTVDEALKNEQFDEVLVSEVEPRLGVETPTFLVDYPASLGSLARLRADDPSVAERVELYIAGVELANGFSELNDVAEQRARFVAEEAHRRALGKQPYPAAERFLEELADMPPAAGMALGVDRLVMLLVGATEIDEVLAFPPEEL